MKENEALKIFNDLDKNKEGKIEKQSFIEALENNDNNDIKLIYEKVYNNLQTKSEIILQKLSKIHKFFKMNEYEEFEEDAKWIMQTISNYDIYDLEMNEMKLKDKSSDFYSMIPSIENNMTKLKDLETFRRSADKHRTITFKELVVNSPVLKRKVVNFEPFEMKIHSFDKTPSINSLSKNDKLLEILKDLETPSFDIFDLNDSFGQDTLKIITKEIFSNKNYFTKLINQQKFNFFIREVLAGYSRTNTYHNDIHAADVLQTVYVMFFQGKIEEVSIFNM